jgi:ComF family protein
MKKIFEKLIDLILPNRCLSCNCFIASSEVFCKSDYEKLDFIKDPKCQICSQHLKENKQFCPQCEVKKPCFDSVSAVFSYNDAIAKLIHGLKYYDQTILARKFGKMIADEIIDAKKYDIIIPIPLNKKRLRSRKFNQSALLCKEIVKSHKNLKFIPNLLLRSKFEKAQAQLSRAQRLQNLSDTFTFNQKFLGKIKGKNILLIDDVMTTGSTLQNCALILKKNGCGLVKCGVIAKTYFE